MVRYYHEDNKSQRLLYKTREGGLQRQWNKRQPYKTKEAFKIHKEDL